MSEEQTINKQKLLVNDLHEYQSFTAIKYEYSFLFRYSNSLYSILPKDAETCPSSDLPLVVKYSTDQFEKK
jgi:hypothetical protein